MTTFEKEEKYQKEREIYAQVFKEFQSVAVNYLILFTLFDNFQHTQSCTVSAQTDIYEINVRVTEIEIYNIWMYHNVHLLDYQSNCGCPAKGHYSNAVICRLDGQYLRGSDEIHRELRQTMSGMINMKFWSHFFKNQAEFNSFF